MRCALLMGLTLLTLSLPMIASANSCVNHHWEYPKPVASNIYLDTSQLSSPQRLVAIKGMNQWNNCSTVSDIPNITASHPGSDYRQVDLIMHEGFHPDNNRVCGEFQGAEIDLYATAMNPNNQIVSCLRDDIFQDTIAHEVGHVMGFGHSGCSNYIMSSVGFSTSGGYQNRSVQSGECSTAASMNCTFQEQSDIEEDNETYNSPILVDLDRNQFHLSSERVLFDLDADGQVELTTWTSEGTLDAFLAYDRDGNGRIDHGGELFGTATRLADGTTAEHGYRALEELDLLSKGGNGDGVVDSADALFQHLLLWIDSNHDGISQSDELQTLADAGLKSISLDYRSYPRRDAAGNLLLFAAKAWKEGNGARDQVVWTTDAFFLSSELPTEH